ncbi:hypothetical protein N752_02430 [Desulforamulus aquiferis]|nr:bifunctional oligoribonuclease/PAP phosphatase NrnA [Desulforamulus aquiferis]RYD06811.1 hypothetical protein N752_02430 [Desulforamulus aquiferis]
MPDGDSLGSILALGLGLQTLGQEVTMVSSDPVPDLYTFLPGAEQIVVGKVPPGNYDLFIALDCSVIDRLGKYVESVLNSEITTLVIDHHVNDNPFGHYNYVEPKSAATGQIVMDLLDLINIEIDNKLAINLYTAIVTDTGSFRYENTTPEVHVKASRLIDLGIPVSKLSNLIFGEQPVESIRLLQVALQSLEISKCGQIAWLSITQEQVQSVGAEDQHVDGLINYPRKIKGVEVAIVFKELNDGMVKVSLRSKYQVDVNLLAKKFGGGGHVRASGCTLKGGLDQAKKLVLTETQNLFRGC